MQTHCERFQRMPWNFNDILKRLGISDNIWVPYNSYELQKVKGLWFGSAADALTNSFLCSFIHSTKIYNTDRSIDTDRQAGIRCPRPSQGTHGTRGAKEGTHSKCRSSPSPQGQNSQLRIEGNTLQSTISWRQIRRALERGKGKQQGWELPMGRALRRGTRAHLSLLTAGEDRAPSQMSKSRHRESPA